jgi:hypothetical protein
MSHVNSLQSSVYAPMSNLPPDVSSLSSESLLTYCETRLRDIDEGVNAQMNDQLTLMNRKKAVNTVLTKAKAKSEKPSADSRERVYKAAEAAAANLPEGDPVRRKLEGLRDKYESSLANAEGDKLKEKWANFKSDLEAISGELGADSEMSMMKLQSIISQRQTIVSLITNMMAKMQQATEQVVANIKS